MTLTEQESKVYEYLVQGLSNDEIAKVFMISKHTVKAHIGAILKKLGVNRIKAAYQKGFDDGFQQGLGMKNK